MMKAEAVESSTLTKKLPDGWRWVQLREVCEPNTGSRNPQLEPDKSFSYVDISSVDNASKRITTPKILQGKDAPSRARQVIHDGDVIVSTTRPNLNAVALIHPELDDQICSTGFCVLRAKENLDPAYLFMYVQSSGFVNSLSNLVKGALYPAVTDTQVYDQFIPIPPISEQKRIAAVLNEQMAAIKRARDATEEQLKATKKLPVAYLSNIFESEEANGWPTMKLGQILRLRKEIIHPYDKPKGQTTFVGLEHVESLTGKRTGALEVEMSELTGRKPRFFEGDIVYGYLRPYLNKVWIAEFDGLCSVDQYVYSVDRTQASVGFVAWFMRSPVYLARAPIDTTPGQLPRIRTEEVATVEINLPEIEEQSRVVHLIEARMSATQSIHQSLETQLESINKLSAALLRCAFNGQL